MGTNDCTQTATKVLSRVTRHNSTLIGNKCNRPTKTRMSRDTCCDMFCMLTSLPAAAGAT